MESDLAVSLMCNSNILRESNLQVGIFTGDDDAASISKVRDVSAHPIVKLSDPNHTGKGLLSQLYKLKPKHKELTTEAINYLKRCFSFAVAQNIGRPDNLAQSLKAIPLHAYNRHEICTSWCRYAIEKEAYRHKTIPGGFKDQLLFDSLVKLFDSIADICGKFAHGASTQRNENFNHVTTSKAPKTRCYGLSESSDFRVAASVCNINIGPSYIKQVTNVINVSPTTRRSDKFYDGMILQRKRRNEKIKTKKFKRRRRLVQNNRTALKYRLGQKEGDSYVSGMGFIDQDFVNDCLSSAEQVSVGSTLHQVNDFTKLPYSAGKIVVFDLETTSLAVNAEIVQIGAICDDKIFNIYIQPTKQISSSASAKNLLRKIGDDLFFAGTKVKSETIRDALTHFQQFLADCEPPCILIAHNCTFDKVRLINNIQSAGMYEEFETIIDGFVDTLKIFRNVLPKQSKYTLESLAQNSGVNTAGAHNALMDVKMLCNLLVIHKIPESKLYEYKQPLAEYMRIESAKIEIIKSEMAK
ncbi:hypothetical protein ABEB36_015630 [Hypothenemus hampei]|uniref:Exonuclease domain-containing protein n=1 Tax=Hypothenemus hampei TaxID=57062 RepID=A0ABD1DZJ1_HYPHA